MNWNVDRRLRIAMVGARGVPANYSGIERAVEELGKRFAAAGHDVTVFCMGGRYEERKPAYEGMKLRYIPSVAGKHAEMLLHAAISSVIAACGPFDIVHFHACGPSLFSWMPRLTGKVTVATVHGQDWRSAKWNRFASRGLLIGEWSACHLATRAICVSVASQGDLRQRLGAEVTCIPNGVAPVAWRPLRLVAEKYGLVANEYVTCVGRLTESKNVHHLIEAFRQTQTNKKLVIIGGDSGDRGYVERLHRAAGGDERVIFTGTVYGDVLAELCSNAYLFCLPSAHEGMSVALLEALSYGVPVLVSDIGSNVEVIGAGDEACGLTFPVGSVEGLRTRLQEALEAPQTLQAYRTQGPVVVASRYSWDRTASETEQVYLELLGRPGRRASSATRPANRLAAAGGSLGETAGQRQQ